MPGRFKDYIAMPKFNMYQSLHTTVIGPEGKPVEIQIRTHTMHRRAEYGVAAHWKYKEQPSASAPAEGATPAPTDMAWLRQLLDWQRETADPGEFLDSLRFEINAREVYVFTPKGDVVALPAGATPVDFAYAVHTEVGHRMHRRAGQRPAGPAGEHARERRRRRGAHLEGRTAPARAGTGWRSSRARGPATRSGSGSPRSAARRPSSRGKDEIAKAMRKQDLPLQRLMSHESLLAIASELRYPDIAALYAAIGEGHVSAQQRGARSSSQSLGGEEGAERGPRRGDAAQPRCRAGPAAGDPGVVVKGADDVWVKLARCCTPGAGRPDHRLRHPGQRRLRAPRGLHQRRPGCWPSPTGSSRSSGRRRPPRVFLVQIQVEALDRIRLLSDVTRVLSDAHVNILSASVQTSRDRVAISRFTFEMGDPGHLGHVLNAVRTGRRRLRRLPAHRREADTHRGLTQPGGPAVLNDHTFAAPDRVKQAPPIVDASTSEVSGTGSARCQVRAISSASARSS